jgi:hypothetical protein
MRENKRNSGGKTKVGRHIARKRQKGRQRARLLGKTIEGKSQTEINKMKDTERGIDRSIRRPFRFSTV